MMKNNDKRPVEDRIAAMQASLKKLSPCLLPSPKRYCDDAIFQLRIYEEVKYPYKDDKYFAKRLTEAEKAVQDLEVAFYDGSDPARTIKLAQEVYNKVYMLTVIPEIKETDPKNTKIRNSFKMKIDGELNVTGSTGTVEVYDDKIGIEDSFKVEGGPQSKVNVTGSHFKVVIGNPPAGRRAPQDAEAEQEDLEKLLVDGDDADLKALTFLRFRINGGYKHDVIHYWIRCLLDTIGRDGTMYGNAMIFRYLTSGHSNLRKSERTLQNAVYKTLTNIC